MNANRLFGAAFLVFAICYIYSAFNIDVIMAMDTVGPKVFPLIIGVLTALFCVIVICTKDGPRNWPELPVMIDMVVVLLVLIIYAAILKHLGFLIATTLASTILCWRLGAEIKVALMAGAGIGFGLYGVFQYVLGLSLAQSSFGV